MDDRHLKMIERIHSELIGDDFTEGLIPKVNRLSKKVYKHELYFAVVIALFAIVGFIMALLGDLVTIIR